MNHYIVHLEPVDVLADTLDEAERKFYLISGKPIIKKIIPARLSFDIEEIKNGKVPSL